MSSIDPAVLMAQWQALQSQNLPTQATIAPQQYQPQIQPQYQQVPTQQTGGYLTQDQINAIADFINAAQNTSDAADRYVRFLEAEYARLNNFSQQQNELINRFLYDREFTLQYIRGAWIQQPFNPEFSSAVADTYLEFDALMPRNQVQQAQQRNPEFTGSPVQFQAQVVPQPLQQPSVIPPLPNSNNGGGNQPITIEQYQQAVANGQTAQAISAAMQNPSALYAALFNAA